MTATFRTSAVVVATLLAVPLCAWPQNYTVSAKPGVVNYIEGTAYLNGNQISDEAVRATFLAAGDSLSTREGKAEVLLSPGVFLRIGDNSEVRMISPRLVNAQVEVLRGEAIIEAAGLVKDNTVQVADHGGSITIERNGLYRFNADNPASVAVLDGKATVYFGRDKKLELNKDHQTIIGDVLRAEKFDPKQEDELYAWSNVRSQYEAAASYQSAKAVSYDQYGGGWGNYGFGGLYGAGWFWNSAFDGYAWLPGSGAFYSPFGWGFYSPGYVNYAPVITAPVYSGGHWAHNGQPGNPNWTGHHWTGNSTTATVPIALNHPPAVGVIAGSPWAAEQARVQAARSFAATGGFNPAVAGSNSFVAGTHVATSGAVAVHGGEAHANGGGWSGGGGGWSGGAAHGGGGAISAASSGGGGGGGHSSGGGHH